MKILAKFRKNYLCLAVAGVVAPRLGRGINVKKSPNGLERVRPDIDRAPEIQADVPCVRPAGRVLNAPQLINGEVVCHGNGDLEPDAAYIVGVAEHEESRLGTVAGIERDGSAQTLVVAEDPRPVGFPGIFLRRIITMSNPSELTDGEIADRDGLRDLDGEVMAARGE